MQPIAPLTSFLESAGVVVHNHNPSLFNDVFDVALVEVVRLQRVVDQVRPVHVARGVKTLNAGKLFCRTDPSVGEMGGVILFVDNKIFTGFQFASDRVCFGITPYIAECGAADDQRRARFVNQDIVDFVDDGKVQWALRLLQMFRVTFIVARRRPHIITEIVEAEFVIRSVRDIAGVGLLSLFDGHIALNGADCEPKSAVDRSHPLHVATREIVVDGNDMDTRTRQGIEIGRKCGDQRFSFAGDHFSDLPGVEYHSSYELDIVVPHFQISTSRLTTGRECLTEQGIECLSSPEPLPEFGCLRFQLLIG